MRTHGRSSLVAVLALLFGIAWTAQANAYVYMSTVSPTLPRANLDGSGINKDFVTPANYPRSVTVDDEYVYWTSDTTSTIGRAKLDGSAAIQNFLPTETHSWGVAVDAQHIYWSNRDSRSIGRANLDGSGIDQHFITGSLGPADLAIDGQYLYWANREGNTIGRAKLDGTGVDETFITGASQPMGVAVNAHHVYWSNEAVDKIGRSNIDGSAADQSFITGASWPYGLTVDDRYVYWANYFGGAYGRAKLDGSGVNQRWLRQPTGAAMDIAVDDGPAPTAFASTTSMAFGTQPLGTFGVPQPVTVTNSGHGGDLRIGAARVAGGDVDDFLISSDTCSGTALPANETCTVRVRFGPSATADRQATLAIPSNDAASPLQVALTGTGGALPQGDKGDRGEPGATGPAGPQGPKGDPGETRVVVCVVLLRPRCETLTITGADKVPARAHASLSRRGVRYAAGAVRHGGLRLRTHRRLRTGRYTLTLRFREHGRRITTRERIAIR